MIFKCRTSVYSSLSRHIVSFHHRVEKALCRQGLSKGRAWFFHCKRKFKLRWGDLFIAVVKKFYCNSNLYDLWNWSMHGFDTHLIVCLFHIYRVFTFWQYNIDYVSLHINCVLAIRKKLIMFSKTLNYNIDKCKIVALFRCNYHIQRQECGLRRLKKYIHLMQSNENTSKYKPSTQSCRA